MKAIKLKWAYHADMRMHFAQEEFEYFIVDGSWSLHKGSHNLGKFDSFEAAKQAAQSDANKAISELVDPDYLLALTKFAMNEGYKNATVPTLVYTAEEVLEMFKQKL